MNFHLTKLNKLYPFPKAPYLTLRIKKLLCFLRGWMIDAVTNKTGLDMGPILSIMSLQKSRHKLKESTVSQAKFKG
jgi:hypothetical protein